jgi:2-methylcitrate dehydratase PrpD
VLADTNLADGDEPELEVRLRSGTVHRLRVAIAKGDHRNPLTDEEVMDKAASLAEPVIGARAFAELAQAVERLPELSDIRLLTRFTNSAADLG